MAWSQVEQLIERALADRGSPAPGSRGAAREKGARRWKAREADTDEELMAAGIRPGDPTLRHEVPTPKGKEGGDDGQD